MRNVIRQSVVLPAPAEQLFQMYLDPHTHGAIAGAPVTIAGEPGSEFRAFEGKLSGQILSVTRPTLIVQYWRSVAFKPEDPDSTLILCFTAQGNEGRIDLLHLDVPDQDYDGVNKGWESYYWTPWRKYLERR
jgi:activator of HSP90 ATPase